MTFRIAYLLGVGALTYICMDLMIYGPGDTVLAVAFCVLVAICSWEILRETGMYKVTGRCKKCEGPILGKRADNKKVREFCLRCLRFGGSDERTRRTKQKP